MRGDARSGSSLGIGVTVQELLGIGVRGTPCGNYLGTVPVGRLGGCWGGNWMGGTVWAWASF